MPGFNTLDTGDEDPCVRFESGKGDVQRLEPRRTYKDRVHGSGFRDATQTSMTCRPRLDRCAAKTGFASKHGCNTAALIIRIGFWGPFYLTITIIRNSQNSIGFFLGLYSTQWL